MSKRDINQLGGMEQVIKLYEKEGEQKTRELLSILGYDLNSGLKEKGKKQSSVTKKREENEVNQRIKQSVVDYFLGCVKKKYPNLTAENENTTTEQQKFVEALGRAYAQYMKEHGDIDKSSFRNSREEILADGFSKYFASNYENLTNSSFLIDFENGPMKGYCRRKRI